MNLREAENFLLLLKQKMETKNLALKDQLCILKQELRFLLTYLHYMEMLEFFPYLRPLSKDKLQDFGSACETVCYVDTPSTTEVSFALEQAKRFQQEIKTGYSILLEKQEYPPISNRALFRIRKFVEYVSENFKYLGNSKFEVVSVKNQAILVKKKLDFVLGLIFYHLPIVEYFLAQVMFVATSAASLSYSCFVDQITAAGMEIKFSDLLQKLMLLTPELIEMYAEPWPFWRYLGIDEAAADCANFILENSIVSMKGQMALMHEEMVFLLKYFKKNLPDHCTGDFKRISVDIIAVALEVATYKYKFHDEIEMREDQIKGMNSVLSWLLEKMKLIKADIFMIEISKDGSWLSMKYSLPEFHEELKFLRSIFVDQPEENTEDEKLFRRFVQTVAEEVIFLICAIHKNEISKDLIRKVNFSNFPLVEKIKLIKAEFYLMELQGKNGNLDLPIKDQIEKLHECLRFSKSFIMETSDREDTKSSLKHIEVPTSETLSFILSFMSKKMTKEIIDGLTLPLLNLLKKVKFIKAERVIMGIINVEVELMAKMKYQIEILKEGIKFLKIVVLGPPEEFKEVRELTSTEIEVVVNEALSALFSFSDNVMKEDLKMDLNLLLSKMQRIMLLKAQIKEMLVQVPSSIPRTTDLLGFISFLLGNLREMLNNNEDNSIAMLKYDLEMLKVELDFLNCFLVKSIKQRDEHEGLKDLWTSVTKVAYKSEFVIDLILVRDGPQYYHMLLLCAIMDEIKLIKEKALELDGHGDLWRSVEISRVSTASSHLPSQASTPTIHEGVIGLDNEAEEIIAQLTRGTSHMDIISIVGMPGLGKTTLAKKVYNTPSVTYHFHTRAWCCVSQVYQRRELMLKILSDVTELSGQVNTMSDDDIADVLRKRLKRKRYLIVMDDLWNIGAWNKLRESFPDDNNGSRVLFTSRVHDVASQAKSDCKPYVLNHLSDHESWELFQKKLLHEGGLPSTLLEIGKIIAQNCKGVPLSIVIVAGLLAKTEKTIDRWQQISKSLSSYIAADQQGGCMQILELSYEQLPDHLKSCFLYLGAFPEDCEIPISKLSWQWIAEGFFQKTDSKSLEDAAEDCLLDLVGRSLVIVAKRRSNGAVKSCQLHDLIRELCLKKVKEENFLQLINGHDELLGSSPDGLEGNPFTCQQRRLCICSQREHFTTLKPCCPHVRCLLFFASRDLFPHKHFDISFISQNFKLLKVLDVERINMGYYFPTAVELLVQLRYLALRGDLSSIPSSIGNLWNLETFLVKGLRGEVALPNSFWNMERLRHVHIDGRLAFSLQEDKLENSSLLENMDTLSTPALSYGEDTEKKLRRLPRLRKLRCIFLESWDMVRKINKFPVLDFLTHLESLKILYHGKVSNPCEFNFPSKLKKLSLSKFRLPWRDISTIGRLPNLEVLKLLSNAFDGQKWEMKEGEFLNLKYLKMENLNIALWNASSSDHLPSLEKLVLKSCKLLEEVPFNFGDIYTLQKIEVHWCSQSAAVSVKQIQEEQRDMGYEELKVLISGMEI